jgi:hypothetical protein
MRLHQDPACGGWELGAGETNLHGGFSTLEAYGSPTRIFQAFTALETRKSSSGSS